MHYLYALRAITAGWTTDQKERLAEVLGRTSRWRGGLSYGSVLAQYFEAFDPLYTALEEKAMLYARAPDFAPLTQEELAAPVAGRKPAAGQRRDVRRSDLYAAHGAAERRGRPRDLRSQLRVVPSDQRLRQQPWRGGARLHGLGADRPAPRSARVDHVPIAAGSSRSPLDDRYTEFRRHGARTRGG